MTELAVYAQRAVLPAVAALLVVAVYSDCRWRLIHNVLTFPFMGLGLVLHGVQEGWTGAAFGLLGLAAGFGLMMIPYTFGQMGGGDVKLLGALGSLLGAHAVVNVFLYTTLAGGLLAIAYAARRKEGFSTLRRSGQLATALVRLKSAAPSPDIGDRAITIPYGVAIAIGTVVYLAVGKVV